MIIRGNSSINAHSKVFSELGRRHELPSPPRLFAGYDSRAEEVQQRPLCPRPFQESFADCVRALAAGLGARAQVQCGSSATALRSNLGKGRCVSTALCDGLTVTLHQWVGSCHHLDLLLAQPTRQPLPPNASPNPQLRPTDGFLRPPGSPRLNTPTLALPDTSTPATLHVKARLRLPRSPGHPCSHPAPAWVSPAPHTPALSSQLGAPSPPAQPACHPTRGPQHFQHQRSETLAAKASMQSCRSKTPGAQHMRLRGCRPAQATASPIRMKGNVSARSCFPKQDSEAPEVTLPLAPEARARLASSAPARPVPAHPSWLSILSAHR